jgi:hypothetical protein
MNLIKKILKYIGIALFYFLYALQILSLLNSHSSGKERLLNAVICGLMTLGIAIYFQKKRIKSKK